MLTQPTYEELEQKVKQLEKETLDLRRVEEALREREERLRESEEKYRSIFENVQDVYYEATLDGIILEASPSVKDVSRYKREEVIGKSLYDVYADPRRREAFLEELLENGKVRDYEVLLKDKDGLAVYCTITAKLLTDAEGRPVKIIGSMHSINVRKRMEESLRESEAQKRAILDASIDRIRYVDKDMRIIWANKAMATALRTSHEDLVGKTCYEVLLGRDAPCEECPTVRAGKTGQIERAVMYQSKIRGVEGESYWDTYAVPLKNEAGGVARFIQVARNVTEQRHAADALKKSEGTLKAILAASPVGIGLIRDRVMGWANKAMYRMLGYSEGSLLGESVRVLYPDEEEYERVGRDLYPGTEEDGIGHAETRWVRRDGSVIHCYLQASPLDPSDPNKGAIVTVMDITARKQAEEQIHVLSQELMRAHENESQMISRELHDRIGQDLSTLKIGLDTLFDNQPDIPNEMKDRVLEFSKVLQKSIQSARDLSYELRPPSLDQLGLVRTIFQYCEDFSEKTGLSVDFSSAGLDDLRLDFDMEINLYRLIQEGLNNIRKHADAGTATIRLLASFPHLILRIEDDGRGFDLNQRSASSTKDKRMGLRSMEERVNLLQGKINIKSRPGEGTRILIEVPYKKGTGG